MLILVLIAGAVLAAMMLARYWYVPFLRKPERIDLRKLGYTVTIPAHQQRVRDILTAFFAGFNAMLGEKGLYDVRAVCDGFPPLLRPFAREGAAVSFPLRAAFRRGRGERDFTRAMRQLGWEYFLMYYIGVGFWCGIAYRRWPTRVRKVADRLDPYYKHLCYDGFGFKLGLFHYLKDRKVLRAFLHFDGYERRACFQGFGRSLWFLFMDAPRLIAEHIGRLPENCRGDCYSGVGLAVAFTDTDDLRKAFRLAEEFDPAHGPSYFLGVTVAAYTRRMIDPEYLTHCLARLPQQQRALILSGLESCDRRFEEVAAWAVEGHYREWRRLIAEDLELALSPRAAGAGVGGVSRVS